MANQPKRPFAKPPTTYAQQVKLLQSRGMTIADTARAEFYLQHLNYYRLAAYWLPFELHHATHAFQPGTNFETVLNLYVFDRELRLLLLDAIERIEVSVRGHWAYHVAHEHGPHAHLDPTLAHNMAFWRKNLRNMRVEVSRSNEQFIRHLTATYAEALPPIWAVSEVISLGLLSKCYKNFGKAATRSLIAAPYQIDQKILDSWLEHVTVVRNICAHHSRLWNREFIVTPKIPRNKPKGLSEQMQNGSRRLYNTLVILLHLMDNIAPQHHWRKRLVTLLQSNLLAIRSMDFPQDWQSFPIWSDS